MGKLLIIQLLYAHAILGEKAWNLSKKKFDGKLADQAVELKLKSVAL